MSQVLAILGGGQLAQMLGAAAERLGIRCRALDPAPDACAARTCELITGAFDDPAALNRLIDGAAALTFEFENVPASTLVQAEQLGVTVRPSVESLRLASDRQREKELFRSVGMAVPEYRPVSTDAELAAAMRSLPLPALLKARSGGYDGRSQAVVRSAAEAEAAWESLGRVPCLAETMVDLTAEVSVIACRASDGRVEMYPLARNEHRHGILVRSEMPASIDESLAATARTWAAALLDRLGYVGVLALELFVTPEGLLANEFAPRVHNTGHATIEASETSQFENHIRAVLGKELGSTATTRHAVMRNLIGTLPERPGFAEDIGTFWHDYGKAAQPGRKLGHITFVGATLNEAVDRESRILGHHR